MKEASELSVIGSRSYSFNNPTFMKLGHLLSFVEIFMDSSMMFYNFSRLEANFQTLDTFSLVTLLIVDTTLSKLSSSYFVINSNFQRISFY